MNWFGNLGASGVFLAFVVACVFVAVTLPALNVLIGWAFDVAEKPKAAAKPAPKPKRIDVRA